MKRCGVCGALDLGGLCADCYMQLPSSMRVSIMRAREELRVEKNRAVDYLLNQRRADRERAKVNP